MDRTHAIADEPMQTTAHYSPDQLLEAGRRAEAQGQAGYALQFYRYLAEQHGQTAEGFEAREALLRLSTPTAPPPARPVAPPPGPVQAPSIGSGPRGRSSVGDLRAVRPEPSGSQHAEPKRSSRAASAPRGVEDMEPAALPARSYRVGRFVAGMLNAVGWLMLLGVLLAVPTIIAGMTVRSMPRGLREVISGNVMLLSGGTFGALVLGLFAVFAAQVAKAAFDTAEGVRWLAGRSDAG